MDRLDIENATTNGDGYLTIAEFEMAFIALSKGEKIRLRKLAVYFANRCSGDADDLLQEAFARILEGRRHCPRTISIVQSIGGIVSSLASEAIETRKKGLGPVPVPDTVFELARHDGISPEEEVVSRIDGGELLRKVQTLVDSDEECGLLLEGIFDGMKGTELEELLGVDTIRLATVQRRLQRKIAYLKAERAST